MPRSLLSLLALIICTVPHLRAAPAPAAPPPPPAGLSPALSSLKDLGARLDTLEQRVETGKAPADAQNLPLMLFKLEQARLLLGALEHDEALSPIIAQRDLVATLDRASAVSRALGDAVFPAPSQMHERAYIAADGSVQPYWVFVPKNYTARKEYPLITFLHGYDPNINKIDPWIPSEQTWSLATNRGFIFVIPYGRRNSDFVNIGEDDTVAVTEAVKAHYAVDPARVFLMGASMGGYGVYAVGLHRPDMWTALSVMSGRTDFYLWFKLDSATLPPWKRLLYDADDPRHLKANALYLPIFIQHGELDTIVDPDHSRRFTNDLKALHYAVRYREIAGADHYIYWKDNPYEMGFDWLAKLHHVQAPRRVHYTTGSLHDHHAYWADIQALQDYSRLASLDAEVKPNNVIEVKADNIARFVLTPPAAVVDARQPLTLTVNGEADARKFTAGQPIEWPAAASATPALLKTPARCGPIKNCYRDPFLLVYGTLQQPAPAAPPAPAPAAAAPADAPAANGTGTTPLAQPAAPPTDRDSARRFQIEWYRFADGVLPIKSDKNVTEADRKRYNLILFGTRQSNSILAEIADQLPVELTPDGYRLGQQQFKGTDLGVQLCYPSPFDARRMMVVQSGTYWGDALPINHRYDLLPDYIVYSKTLDIADSTNQALAAGYFDGNWQLTGKPGTEPPTPLDFVINPPVTPAGAGGALSGAP